MRAACATCATSRRSNGAGDGRSFVLPASGVWALLPLYRETSSGSGPGLRDPARFLASRVSRGSACLLARQSGSTSRPARRSLGASTRVCLPERSHGRSRALPRGRRVARAVSRRSPRRSIAIHPGCARARWPPTCLSIRRTRCGKRSVGRSPASVGVPRSFALARSQRNRAIATGADPLPVPSARSRASPPAVTASCAPSSRTGSTPRHAYTRSMRGRGAVRAARCLFWRDPPAGRAIRWVSDTRASGAVSSRSWSNRGSSISVSPRWSPPPIASARIVDGFPRNLPPRFATVVHGAFQEIGDGRLFRERCGLKGTIISELGRARRLPDDAAADTIAGVSTRRRDVPLSSPLRPKPQRGRAVCSAHRPCCARTKALRASLGPSDQCHAAP